MNRLILMTLSLLLFFLLISQAGADSWNWKLEISPDDGENWVEVYRIKASRIK